MPHIVVVIIIIVLIISVTKIAVKFIRPRIKGFFGEVKVARVLNRFSGTTFNNYIIIDENGASHQIDHIYVGREGIFVVETKNYSGKIYGSAKDHEWTQVLAGGNVKNKFYNPVKQNATHVYQIKNILPKDVWINSCVVFVKGNIRRISADNVFSPKGLRKYISSSQHPLTVDVVEQIVTALNDVRADISNKEHIHSVRNAQKSRKNNVCPICNATLVLRNGKYGKFYGCSNYPKCKYTKKIE